MAVLKNARHEAFAQAVAKGKSASEAYLEAGFKPHRQNAARLMTKDDVASRVSELQQKVAKKVEVTVESLAGELEEARALAIGEKQSSAAVQATMGKAKLFGFLIERHRHAGPNGGAIPTIDVTKLKGMTNEELELLERALVQIGIVDGDPAGEGEPEE
jgi:hypothetical protein